MALLVLLYVIILPSAIAVKLNSHRGREAVTLNVHPCCFSPGSFIVFYIHKHLRPKPHSTEDGDSAGL